MQMYDDRIDKKYAPGLLILSASGVSGPEYLSLYEKKNRVSVVI
jgi:hypothetical protein